MRPSQQSASRRLPRRRSDSGQHDRRPLATVFVRPSRAHPRQARRPSGAAAVAIRARLAGSARWTAAVVGSCLPAQSSEHARDARHGRALRRQQKSPACSQPIAQISGRAPGLVRSRDRRGRGIRASPAKLREEGDVRDGRALRRLRQPRACPNSSGRITDRQEAPPPIGHFAARRGRV